MQKVRAGSQLRAVTVQLLSCCCFCSFHPTDASSLFLGHHSHACKKFPSFIAHKETSSLFNRWGNWGGEVKPEMLWRKRRDGTTSCPSLCTWPGASLKCAAGQVVLMQRGTAGHRGPSAVLIILCLQGDGVTWPRGGRNSAPAELSLHCPKWLRWKLFGERLEKNSNFSRVERLAWFKNIYFSPQIINI